MENPKYILMAHGEVFHYMAKIFCHVTIIKVNIFKTYFQEPKQDSNMLLC